MADQNQGHPDHPPEKKGTTRRHTMNSQKTSKSAWTRNFLRRGRTEGESKGGPQQDHVPCYDDLHWEDVRGYLEPKFPPGWDFHELRKDDRWTFVVPRKLSLLTVVLQQEKESIQNLKDIRQKDGPNSSERRPSFSDSE